MTKAGEVLEVLDSPSYHSLSLDIQQLVSRHSVQVEAVALPLGPGGFTPLRIGATTALALSLTLKIPLIPYSSFLGLVTSETFEKKLFLDARSESAFSTSFEAKSDGEILFKEIEIEPGAVESPYRTQPQELAKHIKTLFDLKRFSTPNGFKLQYVKQPR